MCGFPKNLVYVLVDLVCVLIVALPVVILKFGPGPSQRGFFCDDQTISYPFYDSTVPTWMLVIFGGGIPLLCTLAMRLSVVPIWISEDVLARHSRSFRTTDDFGMLRDFLPLHMLSYFILMILLLFITYLKMLVGEAIFIHSTTKSESEGTKKFPYGPYFVRVYKTVGIFLFGTLSTQCLTDIFKYTIGRLRPNFLANCAPDYSKFNCTDSMGRYIYVTDYVCTGDPKEIRESRLSFISGHASLSFFFMIYLVLYLQVRITWRKSWLIKPFLQVLAVILAQLTMLSRVNDNKHHWSDVLAGTALGTFVALLVGLSVSDLFPKTRRKPDQSVVPDEAVPEAEEEGSLQGVSVEEGDNGKRNSQGVTTVM